MSKTTYQRRQSLVDLSLQEYGTRWMDGLLDIQRNNDCSLTSPPAVGDELNILNADLADPVLRGFKRDGVKVVTVIDTLDLTAPVLTVLDLDVDEITLGWSASQGATTYQLEEEINGVWHVVAVTPNNTYIDAIP